METQQLLSIYPQATISPRPLWLKIWSVWLLMPANTFVLILQT